MSTPEQEEVPEPGPALVERSVVRGTGDPEGRMVTVDGDVLDRTGTRSRWDGAEWHFEPQPLAWRRVVRLDDDELAGVRAAIEDSGVLDAEPVQGPDGTSIGGSNVTWTVADGDRRHTVELRGVPDVSDPAVTALEHAVELAVATALQRQAPAG